MKFNLTISIGDIINFLLVIVGLVALLLQKRSVKISEQELDTKIKSIEEIVADLETEKKERTSQIQERIIEHQSLKEAFLNSSDDDSKIFKELSTLDNASIIIIHKELASMNGMFVLLARSLHNFILETNIKFLKVSEEAIKKDLPVLPMFEIMMSKNIAYIEQNNFLIELYEAIDTISAKYQPHFDKAKSKSEKVQIYDTFISELETTVIPLTNKVKDMTKNFEETNTAYNQTLDDLIERTKPV